MKTISKETYIEVLESQREHLEKSVAAAKEDLFAIECAIEDLDAKDFDEVEVTETDGVYKFQIVEKK
ncbi:hypothetical protein V9G51_002000 [Vibrio cholerae]